MKVFKIVYTETSSGWFYVEADNQEEAIAQFEDDLRSGKVDLSKMGTESSDYTAEEE